MSVPLRVVSVQVGKRAPLVVDGATLTTAIDKRPVAGPVRVGPRAIEGDEIGHPDVHGRPDQALLLCAAASQREVGARLGREIGPGGFGENLTVEGCDERDVRIGDVFRWGEVELEVSSPRNPCSILAAHLERPDAVAVVSVPHRAGWYVRVLRAGVARASDPLSLARRGDPAWTVERVAAVRRDEADVAGARALLAVEALSASWRDRLRRRVESRP